MYATNISLSLNVVTNVSESTSGLLSGRMYIFASFTLKFGVFPLLAVSALCANVVNIVVFKKMGLSDGVTQNFFILSVSDSLFALTGVVNFTAYSFLTIASTYTKFEHLRNEAQKFYEISYYPPLFPQTVSIATTVVIAVVRSCCVAMPLRVKFLLTARRQLAAILLMSGTGMFIVAYCLAPLQLAQLTSPLTNSSTVYFKNMRWTLFTTFLNVLFLGGFVVALVSLNILGRSLRQAAKFRSASGTVSGLGHATSDPQDNADQAKAKQSRRDARIVRTVALVAFAFIVTSIPYLVNLCLRAFIDGLGPGGKYRNEHFFLLMVSENALMCNAFVNIFIYISNNTRYNKIFYGFCKRDKSTNSG